METCEGEEGKRQIEGADRRGKEGKRQVEGAGRKGKEGKKKRMKRRDKPKEKEEKKENSLSSFSNGAVGGQAATAFFGTFERATLWFDGFASIAGWFI
jgi:hypothetical protein